MSGSRRKCPELQELNNGSLSSWGAQRCGFGLLMEGCKDTPWVNEVEELETGFSGGPAFPMGRWKASLKG